MIFKAHCCLESDSSAGVPGRPKKTTSKKASSADGSARGYSKKRVNAESESEPIAEPPVLNPQPQAAHQTNVSHQSDREEESVGMDNVNEEAQWQQQPNNEYSQFADSEMVAGAPVESDEYYDDEAYMSQEQGQYGQNQIVLTLSYSLMNQVRQTARMEGVLPEDILIELVAEGVTRRAFEDAQRPAPSHLMTRTGYVAPDANGNVHQPQLSHHGMQGNNRGNHNGHNNRRFNNNNNRGNHFQGRNRQNNNFKNKQRNGK